jgi:3,4-dihydroxy 2-butanone 4-phosphate synthase/GTP cyclohydrolase II
VVVLADENAADGLLERLRGVPPMDVATPAQWRRLGLGAQILADLGVRRLRVLGTPRKLVGLAGFGLEVEGYEGPRAEG